MILKIVRFFQVCKLLESLRKHGIVDDDEDTGKVERDNFGDSSKSNFENKQDSVSPR